MSDEQIPGESKRPLNELIDSDPKAFVAAIAELKPKLIELLGEETTKQFLKWWIEPTPRTGFRHPRVVTVPKKVKKPKKEGKPEKELPEDFKKFREERLNDPNRPKIRELRESEEEEEDRSR